MRRRDPMGNHRRTGSLLVGVAPAVVACVVLLSGVSAAPAAAAGQPPQIVAQPADVAVTVGSDALWTAVVSGDDPMKVRGETSADGGATWAVTFLCSGACAGQFGPNGFLGVPLSFDGLRYRVVVTNAYGAVASRAAILHVCEGPSGQGCPTTTPTVVPGRATVAEGDSGSTSLEVPVTLSNPSTQVVTVPWTTLVVPGAPGDQADPSTDYVPVSGTVTFAPGETAKTVTVPVNGDGVVEPDEYVVVSFRDSTNSVMGGFWGLGFGVITNDDPA